jgi:uncharacterized protein YeaO (DUF488 family)
VGPSGPMRQNMLCQASVQNLRDGLVNRERGLVVITMRKYPRGLAREKRDLYRPNLSPDATLFAEFKELEKKLLDHNQAFIAADYESRFRLTRTSLHELGELCEMAQTQDVFLVCQCAIGQRCHRELLLLLARHHFEVSVEDPKNAYPKFVERLSAE